jgi:hypothetical protein
MRANLMRATRNFVRTLCEARGLSVRGTHVELVDRILPALVRPLDGALCREGASTRASSRHKGSGSNQTSAR